MNTRFTTITITVYLLQFILFLVLIKEIDAKNSESVEQTQDVNSLNGNGFASDPKTGLQCNCNCDANYNTTTKTTKDYFLDVFQDNNVLHNSVKTETKPKDVTIFVITPTYSRPTQMADMTRLSQTLSLVKNLFWIVSEDSQTRSQQVAELLNRTAIRSVHLLGPRPATHLDRRSGRGVSNRLMALQYLREQFTNTSEEGVIYFADDDNAYDIRIFEEMRATRKVSMFPVGLIAKLGLSTPIVSRQTAKIIGFHDPFISRRKYAVDMAGFAVNLQLFLNRPKATMPYKVGYEEDYFIKSLGVQFDDLEPKAHNCTQILVWHTKTSAAIAPNYAYLTKYNDYNNTNLPLLYDNSLYGLALKRAVCRHLVMNLCLLLGLLGQKDGLNVGQNASLSDGHTRQQFVQLLVVTNGQLAVCRHLVMNLCLLLGLLGQKDGLNVGQNASLSDGHTRQQFVQLLVVTNGQLAVCRHLVMNLCLLLGLLGQKDGLNVGQNASLSDGHTRQQFVQLLVVTNGQLAVCRHLVMNLCLLLGLLGQKDGLNVGQNASLSDGHTRQQFVQLLVVTNGQL
ncbi:unnamed protein product [Medioppia subpectinata]|uniref:Galactosylgalactosylxylosylprotein 3-beta-glucuronosyltransferase n=1 Tax=Medioppia subpectinata TaxID=1979941 RepID=A0A7R9KVS6_9ACAR|nr:unnamed protein product [Medioppia subpectinata]CAG2109648.1 unnamed protein product [Medioppia subpectinata]